MKPKEIVQLTIAVVILCVAAYLIYVQVAPKGTKNAKNQPTVEKVTPVAAEYNTEALNYLTDASKNRNFYNPPDLKNGVGNPQPFGGR